MGGESDLEIYRERQAELRAQGVGPVEALCTAMNEARERIHQREEAWLDEQERLGRI
ncbi:hypothetical protein [Sphaerisporangium album]|uniref:hypothetical protein n=1 Tax=Sphaerisporangium album TaxID=509200 RepID=UPI0015F00288|nr:hypothetical protein [Sphaerisporangium album]